MSGAGEVVLMAIVAATLGLIIRGARRRWAEIRESGQTRQSEDE